MREAPQTAAALTRSSGGNEWLPAYEIMSGERRRKEGLAESRVNIEGTLGGRWDSTVDSHYKSLLAEHGITEPEFSSETRSVYEQIKQQGHQLIGNAVRQGQYHVAINLDPSDKERLKAAAERDKQKGMQQTTQNVKAVDVPQAYVPPKGMTVPPEEQTMGPLTTWSSAGEQAIRAGRPLTAQQVQEFESRQAQGRQHVAGAREAEARATREEVQVPYASQEAREKAELSTATTTTAKVQAAHAEEEAQARLAADKYRKDEAELGMDERRLAIARDPLERERIQLSIDNERQRIKIGKNQLEDDKRLRDARNILSTTTDPMARNRALIAIDPANAVHLMNAQSQLHERTAAMNERFAPIYERMLKDKSLANLEPLASRINMDRLNLAHDAYSLDPSKEPMVTVEIITPTGSKTGERTTALLNLTAADDYINGSLLNQARQEGAAGADALSRHWLTQFRALPINQAIDMAERDAIAKGLPQANILEALRLFRIAREGEQTKPAQGNVNVPQATPGGPTIPQLVGESLRQPVPEIYSPTPGYGQ